MSNNVTITESPVTIEINDVSGTIAVVATSAVAVEVATAGPQGPPGESAQGYTHNQVTPSATWTMPHNLGFKPSVELLNAGSQEIEGDVVHVSQNVTVAYFTTPVAGYARLI